MPSTTVLAPPQEWGRTLLPGVHEELITC